MLTERKLTSGVWIDLLDPSDEERARVEKEYSVRVAPRAELEEIETSSRLSRDGDVLYMNMPVATILDDDRIAPSPLGFVLSDKALVTIHFARLHTTEAVLKRLETEQAVSAPDIFALVIEGAVDFVADQMEEIAGEFNGISQHLFRKRIAAGRDIGRMNRVLRDKLCQIGYAGDHLSHIRESLLGLQRIITYTLETCRAWPDKDFLDRLSTARHDLQSLIEHETHLSDKAQFLLDANLGFINTQQNDIFKVLTIVSVVGIPPTLIASMYGMNFHFMPELAWRYGYAWGLGLIAVSTIVPMLWFKWRGWW
ncbi:MAG TPA: magnesium transporter CorA family protein [Rhizomicrobium sp.]|nr:magnesium transporter CorA family protein [Rhizomicrobium sp.]